MVFRFNVRFGSLADKPSSAKNNLCPLWSNSGQSLRGSTGPLPSRRRAEAGFRPIVRGASRQPIVGNAATVLPLTTVRIVAKLRTVYVIEGLITWPRRGSNSCPRQQ